MAGLDTSPAPAPSHPTPEGSLSTPRVALVGNPNTGKTSLFNALTGLRAKTANFPGSTVDIRRGRLDLESGPAELIDLPGLYSLDALSPEEALAASVLRGEAGTDSAPDAVLVVIDATHIERNLYLASEVVDLQLPTIVALNMIDAASAARITIEVERLSSHLGCPVVAVSSRTGSGLAELRRAVDSQLAAVEPQQDHVSCTAGCTGCHFAARYDWAEQVATECVETPDGQGHRTAAIDRVLVNPFGGMIAFLAVMVGLFYLIFSLADVPMTMVDEGFAVVAGAVNAAFPSADMHPAAWFVGAASLSMAVFWLAYRAARIRWSAKSGVAAAAVSVVAGLMPADDLNSLLVDGVIAGVGGVVIFLPQICILFFFISLLEQSGYLARGAFVMERLMRLVGLPGKAFVPMISAHACAIPGIMAARVIEDWRDRLVTILVLPLLTCSARLPVYSMVAALLFSGSPLYAALVFVGSYVLGIAAALFSAFCLKMTILKGEAVPLVIELPPYRLPNLRNALTTVIERGGVFLRQAGSVILLISVILWGLATYPSLPENEMPEELAAQLEAVRDGQVAELPDEVQQEIRQAKLAHSFAGRMGRLFEPVFAPLGFDWRINVGVISSFAAREVVVSTLAIMYGIGEDGGEDEETLVETLRRQKRPDGTPTFSVRTGLSLLVFFVLAMQCLPTQAVTKRETGSWKWAVLQLVYMTILAYVGALIVYQGCTAFGLG